MVQIRPSGEEWGTHYEVNFIKTLKPSKERMSSAHFTRLMLLENYLKAMANRRNWTGIDVRIVRSTVIQEIAKEQLNPYEKRVANE